MQQKVRELFDAALDQPVELRQEFLAGACQGDKQLLQTVGKLLAVQDRTGGVLDAPVVRRREAGSSPLEPGSFIGPYKILQELGGGGMGIVYQAVRADEVFQRVCAVKVIRPELSANWLLERFRQERHILARLDHAYIARIVDGGSTPNGLPYFVMDFVDGPSINDFCAQHELNPRQRLTLFQQVCSAVQYLHQNAVIHGDLKPPNILVGNDGTVKLVDFGIASVLSGSEAQDRTRSLPLMTPGYASPEQMRGRALTAASDVYSLGVILYELLTGARPSLSSKRSKSEVLSAVTAEDPAPPSVALAYDGSQPSAGQSDTVRKLKGDLDCIVLRAMHRDPKQRYQSVAELGADIGRYLQDRPVISREGGLVYQGRKFLLRNQRQALATFVIVILLGTVSWQGVELRKRHVESQRLMRELLMEQEQDQKRLRSALVDPTFANPATANQTANPVSAGKSTDASPLTQQLRDAQINDIHHLAEAYRTSFPESVRLWPGMTRARRDLLDQTDRYLHQAEPFVKQYPEAPEQLASAWLWLANVEGNPQAINLHDRKGATNSINEAKRLLQSSPTASPDLVEKIQEAAKQIDEGRD